MRASSAAVILAAGGFVLVAQLVVWLTPVRSLLVAATQAPAAPRAGDGDQSTRSIPGLPQSSDQSMAQTPDPIETETKRAAGEPMVQVPAAGEPDPDGGASAETGGQAGKTAEHGPNIQRTMTDGIAGGLNSDQRVPTAGTRDSGVGGTDPSESKHPGGDVAATTTTGAASKPERTSDLSIADTIRQKLGDPVLRQGAHPDDVAAVEAFYQAHSGPALWLTTAGISPEAQAILDAMAKADEWGLDPGLFTVPPPDYRPTTAEDQAATEITLSLAILKYARAARGGLTEPRAVSKVFAETPTVREPQTVLTEIAATPTPETYLTDLHPKHAQFDKLRQALRHTSSEGERERLEANMDRWRWMPETLGDTYLWLNIPEFMLYVVKDAKTIKSEKIVVGNPNSKTPVLSADMTSIVFNPERIVPTSIIRKSVLPELRKSRGLFGGRDKSVLEQYQLEVRRDGKPIDPSKTDWDSVDLSKITFVQAPGPTNTLGKVQFLFPNPQGIDLHETIVPGQLRRAVRAQGERSPRVGNPGELAGVLLAEDKNRASAEVAGLVANSKTKKITLDKPIPVHTTYFTVVVDDDGQLKTFDDVYNLDARDKPQKAGSASPSVTNAPIPTRKLTDGSSTSRAQ